MQQHAPGHIAVVASVTGDDLHRVLGRISRALGIPILETPVIPVIQAWVTDMSRATDVIWAILTEMSYMLGKGVELNRIILEYGSLQWYGTIGSADRPYRSPWFVLRKRLVEALTEEDLLVFKGPYTDGVTRPYMLLAEGVSVKGKLAELKYTVRLERLSVVECAESDFIVDEVLASVPVI